MVSARRAGAAHDVATAFGYYLVCPEHRAGDAKVATFRAWLLREAERYGARFAALSAEGPSRSAPRGPGR